ncbi:MAG: VWA domain-containing protein [Planctomycetes bacterium]|nr:VWA domain-containing protein [Planctomycetota bacterium]NUQ35624.1 VWA domain-containing protein [Planctomycetaceae bacterium]
MKHYHVAAKSLVIVVIGVCALFLAARMADVAGAESADNAPQLFRTADHDKADAPSGRLLLRMPSKDGSEDNSPSVENSNPPAEPSEPGADDDTETPTFFGAAIEGKVVFVIDVSNSMKKQDAGAGEDHDGRVIGSMSRIDLVKSEVVRMLRNFDENIWFDFVWLAGWFAQPPVTDVWKGELVQCTEGIREAAIETIENISLWPGTPTWKALKRACEEYPNDLGSLVFLTDGEPYPGTADWTPYQTGYATCEWGEGKHMDAVLRDFPGWFAEKKEHGCKLSIVGVGQIPGTIQFLQQLAVQNGGSCKNAK